MQLLPPFANPIFGSPPLTVSLGDLDTSTRQLAEIEAVAVESIDRQLALATTELLGIDGRLGGKIDGKLDKIEKQLNTLWELPTSQIFQALTEATVQLEMMPHGLPESVGMPVGWGFEPVQQSSQNEETFNPICTPGGAPVPLPSEIPGIGIPPITLPHSPPSELFPGGGIVVPGVGSPGFGVPPTPVSVPDLGGSYIPGVGVPIPYVPGGEVPGFGGGDGIEIPGFGTGPTPIPVPYVPPTPFPGFGGGGFGVPDTPLPYIPGGTYEVPGVGLPGGGVGGETIPLPPVVIPGFGGGEIPGVGVPSTPIPLSPVPIGPICPESVCPTTPGAPKKPKPSQPEGFDPVPPEVRCSEPLLPGWDHTPPFFIVAWWGETTGERTCHCAIGNYYTVPTGQPEDHGSYGHELLAGPFPDRESARTYAGTPFFAAQFQAFELRHCPATETPPPAATKPDT